MTTTINANRSSNATNDKTRRTSNGRFAKGNFGLPGTPFARKSAFSSRRSSPAQPPKLSPEDVKLMREFAKEMTELAQKQKDEAKAPPSPNGFSDRPPIANGFQRPPTNPNGNAPPIANGVQSVREE